MPLGIQHSQPILNLMPLEHLERDNKRVGKEVRVDGRMKDVDRPVVRGREEEGVDGGEGDGAEGARVVAEGLVGRGGEVEVMPDETLVVRTDNEVV